jgi:hypothetical protein
VKMSIEHRKVIGARKLGAFSALLSTYCQCKYGFMEPLENDEAMQYSTSILAVSEPSNVINKRKVLVGSKLITIRALIAGKR